MSLQPKNAASTKIRKHTENVTESKPAISVFV